MAEEVNLLTSLRTDKVSLVHRGANKRRFALKKSEENMDEKDLALLADVMKSAEFDGEADVMAAIAKAGMDEKAMNAVKGALRLLNGFRENPEVAKLADMLAEKVGYPAPKAKQEMKPEDEPKKKQKQKPEDEYPEPMAKALEGLPEEKAKAIMKALRDGEDKAAQERIAKAAEEVAIAKREAAEAKATAEKTQAILKAEQDKARTKELIAKAASDYQHVPGKPEDLGAVLKSLEDVDPKLLESVENVLKAADAAIKEGGLFVEKGKSGVGAEDSALDTLTKMAEAIQKNATA